MGPAWPKSHQAYFVNAENDELFIHLIEASEESLVTAEKMLHYQFFKQTILREHKADGRGLPAIAVPEDDHG